jgi:ribonuclease P protein subunit POP4|tara:strand:- start:646 stop:909 length:264 start_codon:yes stop_codon:yes gene_type:complete
MNGLMERKYEMIGLKTTISDSMNSQLINISGKIVFETKNMLTIETKNGRIHVPKAVCKFLFENKHEKTIIEGNKILKRSHERLENCI